MASQFLDLPSNGSALDILFINSASRLSLSLSTEARTNGASAVLVLSIGNIVAAKRSSIDRLVHRPRARARTHAHTCKHTHKHTCKHTHKHTYKHTHAHKHTSNTHTQTYIQTHTNIHQTHTHKHTHKHTTYTQTHTQTQTHTHKHKNTQTQTHTNTHSQTHTQTYTHTNIHTNTHKHKHTQTHTHKHTLTNTHSQTQNKPNHAHKHKHKHIHKHTHTAHTYIDGALRSAAGLFITYLCHTQNRIPSFFLRRSLCIATVRCKCRRMSAEKKRERESTSGRGSAAATVTRFRGICRRKAETASTEEQRESAEPSYWLPGCKRGKSGERDTSLKYVRGYERSSICPLSTTTPCPTPPPHCRPFEHRRPVAAGRAPFLSSVQFKEHACHERAPVHSYGFAFVSIALSCPRAVSRFRFRS